MKRLASLAGRRVLVTGAASGIGLEAARAFGRRGARLLLTDVNEQALQGCADEFSTQAAGCRVDRCDVADAAAVQRLADTLAAAGEVPDVLVNNAGIYWLGGFVETPPETWQRMFDVNVMGIVHMTRSFLPLMRRAGGVRRVVNVASLAAFLPAPNIAAYAMSKHAVLGLSEVLAMELVDSDIGVQVVCPGIIDTPLIGSRNVGANITERQLAMQARYYREHGCSPALVGEAIARGVLAGSAFVHPGPKAWLGVLGVRVSRAFARAFSVREARRNGYLDPGA